MAILSAAKGCCFYCKRKRPLTMDHVVPLSRGGAHAAYNIVAACHSCNASKGARLTMLL
jgi:5-methylcytosine-specific restriction endonuclease McrA